jgi:hypothetical protein
VGGGGLDDEVRRREQEAAVGSGSSTIRAKTWTGWSAS